jgi:hypothetical protein
VPHGLSHTLATLSAGQIAILTSIGVILFSALLIRIFWRRSSSPWDD